MPDSSGLFRAAAEPPADTALDMAAVADRGRALRRRRQALLGGTAVVVVLALASAASALVGYPQDVVQQDVVQQPASPPSTTRNAPPTPSPTARTAVTAAPAPPPRSSAPVVSSPAPAATVTLGISLLPAGYSCRPGAPLVRVKRVVPATQAVATAALEQLFAGSTAAERARGLESGFDRSTAGLLRAVRVRDGVAYVDLHDLLFTELSNASTSCGNVAFTAQIEQTLRQFPTVSEVRFAVEGDPVAYYEWAQIGCPSPSRTGDRCDPGPFQPTPAG